MANFVVKLMLTQFKTVNFKLTVSLNVTLFRFPEKVNLNSNFKTEKMTIQKYNVIVFDMAYRKNFSAESRNLLQFNGKSDIAHQDRCLERTFSRQMTSCTK